MPDDALFDLPADAYLVPPAPANPTAAQRRKRLIAKRIARGEHPLGKEIRLHRDAPRDRDSPGPRCGDCRYRIVAGWPKCRYPTRFTDGTVRYLRDTGGENSDIRKWWPACVDFEAADG